MISIVLYKSNNSKLGILIPSIFNFLFLTLKSLIIIKSSIVFTLKIMFLEITRGDASFQNESSMLITFLLLKILYSAL
jgi:hypothetical protein